MGILKTLCFGGGLSVPELCSSVWNIFKGHPQFPTSMSLLVIPLTLQFKLTALPPLGSQSTLFFPAILFITLSYWMFFPPYFSTKLIFPRPHGLSPRIPYPWQNVWFIVGMVQIFVIAALSALNEQLRIYVSTCEILLDDHL